MRSSRHLEEKVLHDPEKTWTLMAACKDGFVISLTAQDIESENK